MRALPLIAFLVFTGPGVAPNLAMAQEAAPAPVQAEAPIVAEARALMDRYATALSNGDRAGIADLYSRDGAWIFWEGQGRYRTHDAIARRYAEQWSPPAAFEWRDLIFVPTSPDTITVGGGFLWTAPGQPPQPAFYHGQFVREDGVLRIQIEHEGRVPAE